MARKKKFAPNDNNLAIAYYRFSSHSQNEASIDQQRELAHEWADAHGFKIVQEYEDAAISGTTDARPGFQQMLSEVAKIRPHTLIMWKTDRLGRDKYVLAMAKKKIRDAGCEIHLLAEHIPTEGPEGVLIEGLMEAMAEYYSRQLSQNIQRGMDYNAQHALYNGHKLFGYDVDRSTKKYIPDPNTAPFVQWAFTEYASGKPLKTIAEEMNAQGLRTPRNAKFSVNMLNKMLKNRAYIGEYHHGDIVVAGGMPVLVDEATFDRAQRRFAENKRKGSQRAHGMDGSDAPRYWLTGKLYCGECGSTMQGVSGTSKTGRTYYYYYCSAQRRKECHLHKARKQDLEDMVLFALHNIVDDEENVTALALDAAEYYEKSHDDTAYLEALEAKRKEVEKSLANLVKVIEKGVVSDTVTERLTQLEEQKSALNDAIETENVRVSLCEDKHSIQAYFDKFLHADVNDPEIRDQVFEYFVDKVYLYDDKLVVSMWFSEDDKQEITWRDWFSLDEYWTDESPFVKGGSVEFDCFPLSSGCGKTTLLKMINGLLIPDKGTVFVQGRDISKTDLIALRRNIGYAIQGVGLFPHMTVRKNIAYVPSLLNKQNRQKTEAAVSRLVKIVGLDESLLERYPSELSGGQQQRVGIARSLAAAPDILLMDEPFGAVDEITRRMLQDEIMRIHRELGVTIVFITHDIREALKLGSRVAVMDHGGLVQIDTPENIRKHPATDFVKELVSDH